MTSSNSAPSAPGGHYDIAIIGSGSANSFPGAEFADCRIVQIDRGVGPGEVFGGTCLNVGCIPTKMLVHTADRAHTPATSGRFGLIQTLEAVRWPEIRDRIFGRIDPIAAAGEEYRREHEDNSNLTLLRGTARFTGPKALHVDLADGGSTQITAETIVIGAGSRPDLPPIEGLEEARPLTSDTVMRLDQLPASMLVLGSGVIAVEMAHVFASLGVEITLTARSGALLRAADRDVSARLTEVLSERLHVHTNLSTQRVERTAEGIVLTGEREGQQVTLHAEDILVATGRRPNTDLLDAQAAGFDLEDDGRLVVDPWQRVQHAGSPVPGVWAFGDISSAYQLKHVANHQQRIVRHNVLHPEALRRSDTMPIPSGVFTSPQVAWVGADEETAREQARAEGREIRVVTQAYGDVAYGWALEDTTGFLKLIVEEGSTRILGAHIIGAEATILIQQLVQAMSTGQTARDIARSQYWIHPALPELIENALLQVID